MPRSPLMVVAARDHAAAPPQTERLKLGEILSAQGRAKPSQITAALARQAEIAARLGDVLRIESGVSEADILAALETQWRARRLDPVADPPDPDLAGRIGLDRCLRQRILPWRRIGGATVIGAVHPERFAEDREALEEIFGDVMLGLLSEQDFERGVAATFPDEIRGRAECALPLTLSCRSWPGVGFRDLALTAAGTLCLLALMAPTAVLTLLTVLALLALLTLTSAKIAAAIASNRPDPAAPVWTGVRQLHPPRDRRRPVVSILVPLYREDRIAGRLLARLAQLKYPRPLLDICLVVEESDDITRSALRRITLPGHVRVIEVPDGGVRTKPRAMNYALDHCRGSIVGIYDAEDAPDPDQIALVVTRFAEAPASTVCLQGRLSFYNSRSTWIARCFTIDYAMWFAVVLPGIAKLGFPVPLGGTTLFFRREVLEQIGRWDAYNVTEDADLGLRLHRAGYRTELIDTTTREEAACLLWPWIKQRSRWLKGYAMTYATHMRRPGALIADIGVGGFIGVQIVFLSALVQALLAPVLWSWWLVALGLPHPVADRLGPHWTVAVISLLIASEAVNLILAGLALRRTGQRQLFPWALALNPYFMMASVAAGKALIEMVRKPFFWDKTDHGHVEAEPEQGRAHLGLR